MLKKAKSPMTNPSAVVIDNLSLQQVGETLSVGLTDDSRTELAPSEAKGYEVRAVPSPGIQIEELLQLLNAIILSDELIVDGSATSTWEDVAPLFAPLIEARVLIAKPFAEIRSEWVPIRNVVQEALCFSPQLSADFAAFRAKWKLGINDPVFSTLMWGTAGMIARSQYLQTPYLAHPTRGRLIDLSSLAPHRSNAQEIVQRFITTERVKLFDRVTAGQKTRAVTLSLPPLGLEVIAESKDRNQLISTAIQLREKYRHLREWIHEYQRALETSPRDAAKKMAILEAAAADIERLFGGSWWSKLSVSVGMSLSDLVPSIPVGAVIQRRLPGSIRTAVTKIVQRPWDDGALEKLFSLLGTDSPKLRAQALLHLQGNRAAPPAFPPSPPC
ncbi:MAG TPA: hypothetical protein VL200_03250 [Lacunisphaera sp.]|nr:hypothetical protein [Lacunisphaera sp.]